MLDAVTRMRGEGRRAGGAGLRRASKPRSPIWPTTSKQMFLADMGWNEPGLNRLIRAAYDLLGLQTYFTAGVKEVRAWTIHEGDTAPQAAGVIHTDFERGFIRAADHLPSTTSSPARASRAPRKRARCAPKARSTSSRTAT